MSNSRPDSQPPTTEAAAEGEIIRIKRHGLSWSGSWAVVNSELVVRSAYGSRTVPLGHCDNIELAAEQVMSKIVHAWRRALAPNLITGRRLQPRRPAP